MDVKDAAPFKAWSFSSLNDFLNCPRAYALKRVYKTVPVVETEQMRYGTECHLFLENRMVKKDALPAHLDWLEPMMVKVERSGGVPFAEIQMAVSNNLTPCGWSSPEAWCRGIVDGGVRYRDKTVQYDYKTGKRKVSHDQLMLFAGLEFAHFPDVKTVKTGYIWLKERRIDTKEFSRADIPTIWGHFIPNVEKMVKAHDNNVFPPKPSGLCNPWCPATREQCEYKL